MKKARTLLESFFYAVSGVLYSLKTQRNLRLHFFAAFLVMAASRYLGLNHLELAAVFFAVSLVIVTEMINTAVETTVDMITETYHPLARISKNVAAGAVLVAALNAVVIGYLIFFNRIRPLMTALQKVLFGR
ncbi:diacylglycerol kinase [Thermosediminibacter oceani]|uniref:Diacylglycerol kinase n=1 Tax=Thermosediminibacter oceani (strain ATCC BAA-1034 / DSM 16646 / JW/IW-1228P) TaxID=555079 RepID=D9S2Q7_THEOJ|nr:diacylglycerol kinase [Thermosediminibacter oceani]ADL07684.1 diacylglycerol kinase [Thermosediminibacter oceani DSM 16646]